MPFKLDASGAIATQDVNGQKLPIFVHPDGKEAPFDAESTLSSIRSRAEQSQRVETENKELREKVRAFDGIEDAEAAKKAIELMRNVDEGKLVAAGKVEEIKAAAKKAAEDQVAAAAKTHVQDLANFRTKAEKLEQELYAEKIGGSFTRSKLIADKFAIPADMVQARFGQAFKIEEGKVVAYDQAGNKIFSRVHATELAGFDEALELLVDQYPYREAILKGSGSSGSGSGGSQVNAGGKKTITRAQYEATPLEARGEVLKGATLTD